jgi:hypothetical protein
MISFIWSAWRGGEPPVAPDEPVEVRWPNGLSRVYERGDYIMWRNLKKDGSVLWRRA